MADFLGFCWSEEIQCMKLLRQSFESEWPTFYSKFSYLTLLSMFRFVKMKKSASFLENKWADLAIS